MFQNSFNFLWHTNKANQQDTNNISSKITEGAKDIIENIGKGLKNLGK
jgi:hypothetical protein